MEQLIRFNNDYNRIAQKNVLKALMETADEAYPGYGTDLWCNRAADTIRALCNAPDAAVHFLPGATQANFIVIASAISPVENVICADTGHIFCHEAASVEKTGHKVTALPARDGKITAEQVEEAARAYYDSPQDFLTIPKLLYISFPTEYGTIYTKDELTAIKEVCRKYGMYLFVDGARLGYGLASPKCDLTLEDLASLTDVFYIGGTKCGAMFGEAVVITNDTLKKNFRIYMKQNGAVLAKGWLMGLQFETLLKDGTYLAIAGRADEYALRLQDVFKKKSIPLYVESPTNQQFVLLTKDQMDALKDRFVFEVEGRADESHTLVRFCTSWSTKESEMDALIEAIEAL